MGMAASQARFLTLTARKSNTEYQGQQVNQQRTALANESANIYSKLSNMDVPTAPSKTAFNSDRYTLKDASGEKYTITNIQVTDKGDVTKGKPATATVKVNYNEITKYAQERNLGNITSSTAAGSGKDYDLVLTVNNDDKNTGFKYAAKECNISDTIAKKYESGLGTGEAAGKWYFVQVLDEDEKVSGSGYYINENELKKGSNNVAKCYTNETATMPTSKEVEVELHQNSSGRYTKIQFGDNNFGFGKEELDLSYEYGTDEEAYEKAFADYEYKKALYDKEVDKLNAETEIIQNQDKRLELKLKQLDTDRNAINTEMEAVKGYLKKNVEGTFNTFG